MLIGKAIERVQLMQVERLRRTHAEMPPDAEVMRYGDYA